MSGRPVGHALSVRCSWLTDECRNETVRNYNEVVANLLGVEVKEIPDNLIDVLCGYRSNLRNPTSVPHPRHVERAGSIMKDRRQGATSFETIAKKYFSKWSTGGHLSSSQAAPATRQSGEYRNPSRG